MEANDLLKKRTTVYLPVEFHKDLKDICYREGTSMSRKIEELCHKYVENHKTGNPQRMLEYSTLPKMVPLYRTCKNSNKELHRGEFYCLKVNTWRRVKACDRCDGYREDSQARKVK